MKILKLTLSGFLVFCQLISCKEPRTNETPRTKKANLIASTDKLDLLDQKSIDILLSEKAMNFDGLRFDNKRFDYSNFTLGSFRGTYFNNCNLTAIVAKRDKITTDNDFNATTIQGGTNKNLNFSFWKINETIFYKTIIEQSTFLNCAFTSTVSGMVNFNEASIKNSKFVNTSFEGITHLTSSYENVAFENVKTTFGVNFNLKYVNCNFKDCIWDKVSFNNTQAIPSKISGGFFSNLTITSGVYNSLIIEGKPQFSGLKITNASFANAKIDAWIKDSSKIAGLNIDFSGVNYMSSIIEDTIFGSDLVTNPRLNMKNSNFRTVTFRSQVKFINCDLTGSTWPTDISNITFINCLR